jgi:uncharacterized protein (TIGR02679 family)
VTLPGWVTDPALAPLWDAVHAQLERRSRRGEGTVTVRGLDRSGRHAVAALLGRPVVRDTVQVSLPELDDLLRSRVLTGGLLGVVEEVTGRPVRDRRAEREGVASERERPFLAAARWLDGHAGSAVHPWVQGWLAGLRRDGVLRRWRGPATDQPDDPADAVLAALEVLQAVTAPGAPTCSRVQLAADVLGDAHALDDGALVTALVLRGLAAACDAPVPRDGGGRHALWERFAVLPDSVSTTCLTLGLDLPGSLRWRLAREEGAPVHVTRWDLRKLPAVLATADPVLVCENPRVLEAVAERCGGAAPVVATSGQPGLVTMELLGRLRAGAVELCYHGDFDWPGIAIANRLVATVGARPWCMAARDYEAGLQGARPALTGAPVQPSWDGELGAAMRRHALAVHEETVLEPLLALLPTRS